MDLMSLRGCDITCAKGRGILEVRDMEHVLPFAGLELYEVPVTNRKHLVTA